MRLAKNALIIALVTLAMVFAVSAQTLRSPDDNRNLAPTVGSGAAAGGATGLFTVIDGSTLRKGEYTFSIAYSNFDRDPGNVDITEVPVSFNIGLSDHLELFFNTDAWKGIKVNNPQNLSSFYLPNSQLPVGTQPGAIVLAPGTSGSLFNTAIFRPAGAPFTQFPFVGGRSGNLGLTNPFLSGPIFGFPAGTLATLGPPRAGGAADNFPGFGSVFGSILPGIVLSTQVITDGTSRISVTTPQVFSAAPSYLPDAPFINRRYGQTAFSTMTAGAKFRFTGPNNPFGIGVVPFYRWYNDNADAFSGFNQLQRGASPGGNRGDIGMTFFADARAATWLNISANATYIKNSSVKAQFPTGTFTILDRPDEFQYGVGLDFPVNKNFQPILEYRQTKYVGGRTPNAFENEPLDMLGGFRIYPKRWFGFSFAYRYHANQQKADDSLYSSSIFRQRRVSAFTANAGAGNVATPIILTTLPADISAGQLSSVFRDSTDPHGYIAQFFIGRRNARELPPVPRPFIDVTSVDLDSMKVTLPCPPGTRSSGACNDDQSVAVKTGVGANPDNDVLTYNYTVSGGRIVGQGSSVNWDLSGVKPGTYTITSAVDNGCGFCGKTQTKTITVEQCIGCNTPCNCPTLSVNGPSSLTDIGGNMTFTANLSGGTQDGATYNWTVSGGTITSGQGTSAITVSTTPEMAGQTVTATATVGGLCADCGTKDGSASGEIATPPPIKEIIKQDELGLSAPDDVKARLQNLQIAIQNEPNSSAIVRVTGPTAAARKKQITVVNKAIDFLKYDRSNYRVVDGGDSEEVRIEFYFVPAGVTPPF